MRESSRQDDCTMLEAMHEGEHPCTQGRHIWTEEIGQESNFLDAIKSKTVHFEKMTLQGCKLAFIKGSEHTDAFAKWASAKCMPVNMLQG